MSVPGETWTSLLEGLDNVIIETNTSALCAPDMLLDIFTNAKANLARDLSALDKDMSFAYRPEDKMQELTDANVHLLRKWHFNPDSPTLMAMVMHAIDRLAESCSKDLKAAALVAATLGEVVHDHAYHNNLHFRKVLLQTIRLVAVHNVIYEGTSRALSERQCALLLIAACIHDIGHDGKGGNFVKGVFQQFRLELQSYEMAEPYFRAVGLNNEDDLALIRVMLLSTDVNPLDDRGNPMNQMKSAYRYHFLGEKEQITALNLDPELALLQKSTSATMMSLLLHEADIATSAGLSYPVSKFESIKFREESNDQRARPSDLVHFLDNVCQRKMLSDAAQRLYGANCARILVLAEADVQDGNLELPEGDQSEFWLMSDKATAQGSKTIN